MIQARLAAPRRAALLTTLVLGAAALRAVLLPLGDLLSTLVFAICLLGISLVGSNPPPRPSPTRGEGEMPLLNREGINSVREGSAKSLMLGLGVGMVLLLPVATGPLSGRPIGSFWSWAMIAAAVAALEEAAIRGALYRQWLQEAGAPAAMGVGALVFALIHLPRYGLGAMPLDFAVGLALGGLRAVTGRVMPCVVAHTIADWGAWFWA